jgi:hypothetical protein
MAAETYTPPACRSLANMVDQHCRYAFVRGARRPQKTARLIVSQIVLDTFDSLDMQYPTGSAERKEELEVIRKALET